MFQSFARGLALAICLTACGPGCFVSAQGDASKTKAVRNENPSPPAIPDGEGWKPLFNGKDLSGWTQRNGWAVYRIDGDSIVGITSKASPNSFLCTNEDYSDFEIRFEVKVDSELNSGVQIRSRSIPERDNGRVHGPQVEIEANNGEAGYIYGEATVGWISPTQTRHAHFKKNEWNQYHVRAVGPRLQTWINGKLVEDLNDTQSNPSGFIGLQVHGIAENQGPFQVQWRKIEIRDLAKK